MELAAHQLGSNQLELPQEGHHAAALVGKRGSSLLRQTPAQLQAWQLHTLQSVPKFVVRVSAAWLSAAAAAAAGAGAAAAAAAAAAGCSLGVCPTTSAS